MKIAVIHGYAPALIEERRTLLEALVGMGHDVHALAPALEPDVASKFEAMGVGYSMIPLTRRGFTPIADIGSLLHLKQVLYRIRPDMVLSTTSKAMIYGSLAARMAWVGEKKKVFAIVSGLGYAFTRDSGLKRRLLFGITKSLTQAGFKSCDGIIFRRAEDEAFFRQLNVIPDHVRTVIVEEPDAVQAPEQADNAILFFMGLL
jgi:hypothetical protein